MQKKNLILLFSIFMYCLFLKYLLPICFPFIIAIVIYFMIKPIIDCLERYFDVHHSAIGVSLLLVIYLMIALVIGGLIGYLGLFIIHKIDTFPLYYEHNLFPFMNRIIDYIQLHYSFLMTLDNITMIQELMKQSVLSLMSYLSQFLTFIPTFLFSFFLFLISTFFLVLEYDQIREKVFNHFSPRLLKVFLLIKESSFHSFQIYLKCQIFCMFLCFFILWIGFSILKINHSCLWALCISFLDSLPFIGVGIALLPMCFLFILETSYMKALYLFLIYLMINVLRSLLEPRFMNMQLKIPSFFLLLSMVIHLHFFGITGIVLSPIHMNLLYSFLDNYDIIMKK